jgi:mono/diheme cytochrome c family protein
MLKPVLGLIAAVGFVLAGSATLGRGCRDVRTSFTELAYPDIRDMRRSVVINPQKRMALLPDSIAIPVGGREAEMPLDRREAMTPRITDPTAGPDSASIARGEARYRSFCSPCHGGAMAGDGPVAQFYMPPPDLLGPLVRSRSDGHIYAYIRDGGAVMPKYGQSLTPAETWDVIHYLRMMQQTSPR